MAPFFSEDSLLVYLVRHGETLWNAQNRIQGSSDTPLSEVGRRQATAVANRLRKTPVSAIYSSPLERARETAQSIALPHGLPVTIVPDLRETCLGEWEGLTHEDIRGRGQASELEQYRRDPVRFRPRGAETLEAVAERMTRALHEIRSRHNSGTVVIVGHGGSMRTILALAAGAPPIPCLLGFRLDNGSVSLVEFGATRSWIRFANDTCHLREAPADEGVTQ